MTSGPHRVWRLPAAVSTQDLAPAAALAGGLEVVARHCLATMRPDFAAGVARGDVIVAGPGFGTGAPRGQAAGVLVHLGVAAVVAPAFAGSFFRHAFNAGLLLLTCPRAEAMADGERVAIDARAGRIVRADGDVVACGPVDDRLLALVDAGGLLALLRQRLQHP